MRDVAIHSAVPEWSNAVVTDGLITALTAQKLQSGDRRSDDRSRRQHNACRIDWKLEGVSPSSGSLACCTRPGEFSLSLTGDYTGRSVEQIFTEVDGWSAASDAISWVTAQVIVRGRQGLQDLPGGQSTWRMQSPAAKGGIDLPVLSRGLKLAKYFGRSGARPRASDSIACRAGLLRGLICRSERIEPAPDPAMDTRGLALVRHRSINRLVRKKFTPLVLVERFRTPWARARGWATPARRIPRFVLVL